MAAPKKTVSELLYEQVGKDVTPRNYLGEVIGKFGRLVCDDAQTDRYSIHPEKTTEFMSFHAYDIERVERKEIFFKPFA